jgi:hypothetical protein
MTRKTLSDKMALLAVHVKLVLKLNVLNKEQTSLTSDIWTAGNGLPYISLTAHWLDEDLVEKKTIH